MVLTTVNLVQTSFKSNPSQNKEKFLTYPRALFSFGAFPFFVAGLFDGVNLFALTTTMIFITVLFYISHDRKFLFWYGASFIFGVFYTWMFYIYGRLDRILNSVFAVILQKGLYAFIAIVFIIIAILSFFDWMIYWKTSSIKRFSIRLPEGIIRVRSEEKLDRKENPFLHFKGNSVIAILSGFLSALFLTLLGTFWPPHENVLYILYQFSLPGQVAEAFHIVLLYCFAFVLPLLLIFLVFLIPSSSAQLMTVCSKRVSLFKIVSSSVLLSLGLGIIYFFLQIS